MSQYTHLSTIDPEFAEASESIPTLDPPKDVAETRQRFDFVIMMANGKNQLLSHPAFKLRVEEHKVPAEGGEIIVRCMIPTPDGGAGPFPLHIDYHGGGWVSGSLITDDAWLRQFCVEQQTSVVDVDYRLAPECPWPIPHEDSYAALKWVSIASYDRAAENTALLHTDPTKGFIVGGTSAGGNLAASMALRARDDPFFQGQPVTGQYLQVPATILPSNVPDKAALHGYALGFLNKEGMARLYELWKPDPSDINTWPLLHPSHAGVAPAVIQICGMDPLRDEGLLYEKVLKEAGVKTRLHVYPGVPHGFHAVFSGIKLGKQYHEERNAGLRWLLSGAISSMILYPL